MSRPITRFAFGASASAIAPRARPEVEDDVVGAGRGVFDDEIGAGEVLRGVLLVVVRGGQFREALGVLVNRLLHTGPVRRPGQ